MRYAISNQVMSGESKDVLAEKVNEWLINLSNIIYGYKQRGIYNVDESGLFYYLIPARTLDLKGDNCNDGNNFNDHLSVLLHTNADGSDKKIPIIIRKSRKTKYFNNVKTSPLYYGANKLLHFLLSVSKENGQGNKKTKS